MSHKAEIREIVPGQGWRVTWYLGEDRFITAMIAGWFRNKPYIPSIENGGELVKITDELGPFIIWHPETQVFNQIRRLLEKMPETKEEAIEILNG